MADLYERKYWLDYAVSLGMSSGVFMVVGMLLGVAGIVFALVIAATMFSELRGEQLLIGLIGPAMLGIQSVLIIVFAMMMRAMSKVLVAVFEMSVAETRQKIERQESGQ